MFLRKRRQQFVFGQVVKQHPPDLEFLTARKRPNRMEKLSGLGREIGR
jgi:hypothetical protein